MRVRKPRSEADFTAEIEASQERKPTIVIEPGATPVPQYLHDLWRHRDLIRTMGRRDLTLRYRQTVLGPVWIVLQPILAAGLLSFVFGKVADLPTDGIPTFLFTYSGLLAWNSFSSTLSRSTTALIGSASLVSKIFFPRLALLFAGVAAVLVDFCVALAILFVLMATRGYYPGPEILLLPVWLFFLIAMAQGIGAFIGSFAVRYRDFSNVTPFFLQLGLYVSPVAYAVSAVPEKYRTIYYLNPLVSLIEAVRWSLFATPFPSVPHIAYSFVGSLALFVIGCVTFERKERFFADVI